MYHLLHVFIICSYPVEIQNSCFMKTYKHGNTGLLQDNMHKLLMQLKLLPVSIFEVFGSKSHIWVQTKKYVNMVNIETWKHFLNCSIMIVKTY